MKKYLLSIIAASICIGITACNGGGGGSPAESSNTNPYAGFSPYPYPTPGNYQSLPFGFESAIPSFVTTTSAGLDTNGLQIAYGYNNNPAALNLVAGVILNSADICSATPIQTPSNQSGGTWLIGAAHCFVTTKNSQVLINSDILSQNNIAIYKGATTGANPLASSATVFIPNNYCQGGTIDGIGTCQNFSPSDGAVGGQGNDIALIHINGTFNLDSNLSPQIAGSGYPAKDTMAPVLSLGYGNNTSNSINGMLFFVVNYFYQQSDDTGYHYLYNSYFNNNPGSLGYSALICGGDSGGGDLYSPDGISWILLSEHTYGPNTPNGICSSTFYTTLPNAATNVSAYYSWLTSLIGATDPVATCSSLGNCATNG